MNGPSGYGGAGGWTGEEDGRGVEGPRADGGAGGGAAQTFVYFLFLRFDTHWKSTHVHFRQIPFFSARNLWLS